MNFKLTLILVVICNLIGKSQESSIPEKYLQNYPVYYEEYLNHDVEEKYLDNYARENAQGKFSMTFYHNVYYDQQVLVDYIKSILKRLSPSTYQNHEIYITRSTEFNAFAIVDGSFFVNISALATMSSEAELAFLVGHELSHHLKGHVKDNYLERRKAGRSLSKLESKSTMELSQKSEYEADSLGFQLACKAGYDPRAMDLLVQRLIFMQKKAYLSSGTNYNKNYIMPTSHPIGEDRLAKIKGLKAPIKGGDLYPSGKERFEQIKRLAEFEYLKLLDEGFDIHNLIMYSLKMYLTTGSDVYLPTLVRGIRKAVLVYPAIRKEGFMTTQFSDRDTRFGKKENIIHHLFYEYPDSTEVKIMHEKGMLNYKKVPFYTFEQAFKFFAKKAIEAGYEEPYLDKALFFGPKTTMGKRALTKYLKNSNNLYHEFARTIKDGKLNENLSSGDKVVLIGGFHKMEFKKNWVYDHQIEEFKGRHELLANLRARYDKHELDYKLHNYKDFVQYNPLGKYLPVVEMLIYSGNTYSMFDYDPRIYYAFKKANIASLEYLDVNVYTIQKRWLRSLLFIPPLTAYAAYKLLFNFKFFSPYISVTNYYQLSLDEGFWRGGYKQKVKHTPMSEKRAVKIMYNTHKKARRWQMW